MKRFILLLLISPLLAFANQDNAGAEIAKLNWVQGPSVGPIGNNATIKVDDGFAFLGESDTRRFLELTGNPPQNGHYLIAPKSLKWFAVFNFHESGYVKDDEKIDADELLRQLKASDASSNEERKRLGMEALYTDGWQVPPHYDSKSNRLEWGVRLRTAGNHYVINYTSRLLGRKGYMNAILVSSPEALASDTGEFKNTLAKFSYLSGESYAEFRPGDHVAEFGLGALVLGGAAAVATKKGLWAMVGGFLAAFWKVLAGASVAALAGLRGIFKKKV